MSSAKNLDIANYRPYEYDLVLYSGTNVDLTRKGKNTTHQYEAGKQFEVSRLQVKANQSPIIVKGFTFKNQSGLMDIERFFDKASVLVNDQAVSNLKTDVKRDGTFTVSFDPVKIDINKRATFTLNVALKDFDKFGESIKLNFDSLNAVEEKTGARATVNSTFAADAAYSYKFNGGVVKLTNTKLPNIIDAAKGSVDVVVAQGKVEVPSTIKLNKFDITITSGSLIEEARLLIAGEDFNANISDTKLTFDNVLIEKSGDLKLLISLKDDGRGTEKELKVTFVGSLSKALWANGIGFYDEANRKIDSKDFIGSISFSTLRVQPAKGTLYNNTSKRVEVLDKQSTNVVMFDGEYLAKQQDIILKEFVLSGNKVLDADENIDFTLVVNGNNVGTINFSAGEGKLTGDIASTVVKKGEKVSVKLLANAYLIKDQAVGSNDYKYSFELFGEDKDGNIAGYGFDSTVILRVLSEGAVEVSDVSINGNTLLLKNTNLPLAKFTVRPANNVEGVTLESFEATLTSANGGDTLTDKNIRVRVAGTEVTDFTLDTNGKLIAEISETLPKDGAVIEIFARNELNAGDYTVNLEKVNKADFPRTVKKKLVSALVKVTAMDPNPKNPQAIYTLAVEKSDSNQSVTGFVLTFHNGLTGGKEAFVNGDTFPITKPSSSSLAKSISYFVDGNPVTINEAEYKDYFKADGKNTLFVPAED